MSLKQITLEELKAHNTARELWLAIHDKVYDVTKFIDLHPGGEEVIVESAGKYATEAFEDVGHSTDARDLMKDYLIGELVEEARETQKAKVRTSASAPEGQQGGGSLSSWLIPLGIAIAAALLYKFIISPTAS